MVYKLDFEGVAYYPSRFKNENFFEGRPVQVNDAVAPSTTIWNNKTFNVQNIIYPVFECKIYQKETFFSGFSKIQYASKITLKYDGETYDCLISEYVDSYFIDGKGFKEVIIRLKVLSSTIEGFGSQVVNSYGDLPNQARLRIRDSGNNTLFDHRLKFELITKNELSINEVDNSKDQIKDYTKLSKVHNVRLILSSDELQDFYTYLAEVSLNSSKNYIRVNSGTAITMRQYEILNEEDIGEDLYQIDLKLIETNTINTLWN